MREGPLIILFWIRKRAGECVWDHDSGEALQLSPNGSLKGSSCVRGFGPDGKDWACPGPKNSPWKELFSVSLPSFGGSSYQDAHRQPSVRYLDMVATGLTVPQVEHRKADR